MISWRRAMSEQRNTNSIAFLIAFLWGLAEATVFFIVVDVFTSRVVLSDRKSAMKACIFAVLGAVVGGSILYILGRSTSDILFYLDWIPGISFWSMEQARRDLHEIGAWSLFTGAAMGIPYKIYAAQAYAAGDLSYGVFLVASLAARFLRFFTVTLLAQGLLSVLPTRARDYKYRIHVSLWMIFYSVYFYKMGF